jgi:hypothetical protein
MDSFWQQHRTFILKILGGLLVVIVCWIIGSSLTERSLADLERDVATQRSEVKRLEVPSPDSISGYAKALASLDTRIRETAARVGETRKGDELPAQVFRDILQMIGKDTEPIREAYRRLAAQDPMSCVTKLVGESREYLEDRAGPANVQIDGDLGFARPDFEAAEAPRYLMALRLIVRVVNAAIEERVLEVKSIGIGSPPLGKFEGGDVFLREYPVSMTIRGTSASVLALLGRLNDPAAFVPVKALRRLVPDKSERNKDIVIADLDVLALHIDPESELGR